MPPFNGSLPNSTELAEGQSATLMVSTSFVNEASYQWYKDGNALIGQTFQTLTINDVSSSDAGSYRVETSFDSNTVSSDEIEFVVLPFSELEEPFRYWLSRFFRAEELDVFEDDPYVSDPDNDGLTNFYEYGLGLSPNSLSELPEIRISDNTPDSISIEYTRAQNADYITYVLEGSASLDNWTPLVVKGLEALPQDDIIEDLQVDLEWTFDPDAPRFIRLKISDISSP